MVLKCQQYSLNEVWVGGKEIGHNEINLLLQSHRDRVDSYITHYHEIYDHTSIIISPLTNKEKLVEKSTNWSTYG